MAVTLTWPVKGYKSLKIEDTYDKPYVVVGGKKYRYKRGLHGGIDLAVKEGTPLLACYQGRIVYPDWGSNYGKHFLVVNRNSVGFLYAHCDFIAVPHGTKIERGEYLGDAGESGNASGPHLHFELHPDAHDWKSISNPYKPLVAAQRRAA